MNQERYLKGATLIWGPYRPRSPDNDHDHCEFCQEKFMMTGGPESLHQGYCTPDRNRWICQPCFNDFLDLFSWKFKNEA